jgi:hypothetical protein
MEASGNKDHYRYKEFIRMIIEEAEKNSWHFNHSIIP